MGRSVEEFIKYLKIMVDRLEKIATDQGFIKKKGVNKCKIPWET